MDDRPQWPNVIGTIGIVLGIVLLLDSVDDLITVRWTAAEWRWIFPPDLADLIARSMPPAAWRAVSAAVEIGLAALLIVGSVALRRRTRHGVSLCRLWAWLAIVWVVVVIGRGMLWLAQHGGELPGIGAIRWEVYVPFAFGLAAALLLAFPVFLLVWLSRTAARSEYEAWPR